jgi:ribonuclease HII
MTVNRFELQPDQLAWTIGFDFEEQARDEGYRLVAGVDEVGRGCLAGPVVAAACILDPRKPVPAGLNDSKKLTEKRRESIAAELRETALSYAIAEVDAGEIDSINILQASIKAMCLAVQKLDPSADYLLIDAVRLREVPLPQKALIKGDSISYSIAAASVLAKVYRDAMMKEKDLEFPQYGFAGHKGYGSAAHLAALRQHGPCPLHRRSFRGVL